MPARWGISRLLLGVYEEVSSWTVKYLRNIRWTKFQAGVIFHTSLFHLFRFLYKFESQSRRVIIDFLIWKGIWRASDSLPDCWLGIQVTERRSGFPKVTKLTKVNFKPHIFSSVFVFFMLLFYFLKWLKITTFCFFISIYFLQNRKQRHFLQIFRSQVLIECLSWLVLACLELSMSQAWTFTRSTNLKPGFTQIKAIIGAICLSYFAPAGIFWLWLFPESMETILDEWLFNHNFATKITPFKSVPMCSTDMHQTASGKVGAGSMIRWGKRKRAERFSQEQAFGKEEFPSPHPKAITRGAKNLPRAFWKGRTTKGVRCRFSGRGNRNQCAHHIRA